MLIPLLKKSNPADFADRVGKYLASVHSPEEAAHHAEALKHLNSLRAKCLGAVEPNEANTEMLLKYWSQLSLVENRIDWAVVNLPFTWADVWKGASAFSANSSRTTLPSLKWEQACVLFNCAVMHARIGERELTSSDGDKVKSASANFRKAAGMFLAARQLASALGGETLTPDMGQDCLSMMENLCLAHAQRCFYEKASRENMKASILAKLAGGVADLYGAAHAPLAEADSPLNKASPGGKWAKELAIEMLSFR
mmetsp:Transcript_17704/g.34619  ORF Transcript_17704/g.34619 Transcript_17704/m.34619 type:complete len:254 (+) Transcript_17704:124-885(+)